MKIVRTESADGWRFMVELMLADLGAKIAEKKLHTSKNDRERATKILQGLNTGS